MRVGVVDIGTNTVRLLLADVEPGGALADVERRSVVVGLGTNVDRTGRFDDDAITRATTALSGFGRLLDANDVRARRAVATSASRDAADAGVFFDTVEGLLGVRPQIIAGEVEAALSFAGAVWGLPGPSPTLVIDPGGGSTELVSGGTEPEHATSVDIGSVRLTERHLPDRPASEDQMLAARHHVADLFGAVDVPDVVRVVGVGGTFTTLAAIVLGLDSYDRDRVHGASVDLESADRLVAQLSRLTVAQTAAIPSMDPARAPVLLGGAVVVAEAIRWSGHSSAEVSESDLLDAMVRELAVGR